MIEPVPAVAAPADIVVPCIEITQPLGKFYIAVFSAVDLIEISWADIRRIYNDERKIEIISGIQRPLSKKRIVDLQKYVNHIDASFPTGVILAMSSEDAKYDPETRLMRVRRAGNVAEIIDGQHRIEGLRGFTGKQFQVNTAIFIDMETEDQAILFATINLEHTKVNQSLVYDLFDYTASRSPQKTCHNIARALNSREDSPFFERIMVLGVASGKANETITQAAFIKPLITLIATDEKTDRDIIKRRGKLERVSDDVVRSRKLVFRNQFIEGKDGEIAATILNYFSAVADRWPIAWNVKQQGLILNRSTGFRALMRFLPFLCFRFGVGKVPSQAQFSEQLSQVRLEDLDFSPERFKPGSSGEAYLLQLLQLQTGLDERSPWKNLAAK